MRYRKLSSLVCIGIFIFFGKQVSSFEKIIDFRSYNLKITDTRVEEKISNSKNSIQAGDSENLIVIKLQGSYPELTNVVYIPDTFAVTYLEKRKSQIGVLEFHIIRRCAAIRTRMQYDSDWNFSGTETPGTMMAAIQGGEITIEIAAIIPKNITNCSVIIPTLIENSASLPVQNLND